MYLQEAFEKAVAGSKELPSRPNNETLLQLYSLYKQATDGDINAPAPAMFDFVAQAKFDAWNKLKGTTPDEAMQQYVDLVNRLSSNTK